MTCIGVALGGPAKLKTREFMNFRVALHDVS